MQIHSQYTYANTAEKRKECFDNNLCFNCGKPGHQVSQCQEPFPPGHSAGNPRGGQGIQRQGRDGPNPQHDTINKEHAKTLKTLKKTLSQQASKINTLMKERKTNTTNSTGPNATGASATPAAAAGDGN